MSSRKVWGSQRMCDFGITARCLSMFMMIGEDSTMEFTFAQMQAICIIDQLHIDARLFHLRMGIDCWCARRAATLREFFRVGIFFLYIHWNLLQDCLAKLFRRKFFRKNFHNQFSRGGKTRSFWCESAVPQASQLSEAWIEVLLRILNKPLSTSRWACKEVYSARLQII